MCAKSIDRARRRLPVRAAARGFTMPELIAVLLLVGILAANALPKLQAALTFRDAGWHDQVVGALRYAQKVAVSHRRLVCASVGTASITLSIAAANPATSCSTTLAGTDGQTSMAVAGGGAAASVSPSGTLYFQPTGRVTSDGAGTTATGYTISISGQTTVVLVGETGHVE